jgi:hypothetical protein
MAHLRRKKARSKQGRELGRSNRESPSNARSKQDREGGIPSTVNRRAEGQQRRRERERLEKNSGQDIDASKIDPELYSTPSTVNRRAEGQRRRRARERQEQI